VLGAELHRLGKDYIWFVEKLNFSEDARMPSVLRSRSKPDPPRKLPSRW
jgi:hypothetical protein